MQEKNFNWNLSVQGRGEISNIWLYDIRHQHYDTSYQWLNTLSKKPLPADITVFLEKEGEDKGLWVKLYADKEKLFDRVEALTSGNGEMPLEFILNVKDSVAEGVEFLIKTPEQIKRFKEYELELKID